MVQAQSENKNANEMIYQMLSDVIQTAKYGTATKKNALQILLHIQILLYTSYV